MVEHSEDLIAASMLADANGPHITHWQKVVLWGRAEKNKADDNGGAGPSGKPVSRVCTFCKFLAWQNVIDAANDMPILHLSSLFFYARHFRL